MSCGVVGETHQRKNPPPLSVRGGVRVGPVIERTPAGGPVGAWATTPLTRRHLNRLVSACPPLPASADRPALAGNPLVWCGVVWYDPRRVVHCRPRRRPSPAE